MSEIPLARDRLVRGVLHLLIAERNEPHAHFSDELEYAEEMVDAAARELVGHLS